MTTLFFCLTSLDNFWHERAEVVLLTIEQEKKKKKQGNQKMKREEKKIQNGIKTSEYYMGLGESEERRGE